MKLFVFPFYALLSTTFLTICTAAEDSKLLTGKAAMADWTQDAPGTRRKITLDDLPQPFETKSADNHSKSTDRPQDALPKVPAGFEVQVFAEKLSGPRAIVTAPNGDFLVAESYSNRVRILRDADNDGQTEISDIFAEKLNKPFGIAFYPVGPDPKYVYVANTDGVVRWPYQNGQLKVEGEPEKIVDLNPGGQLAGGGHWTRDLAFSKDGSKLFISIGSKSNVDDNPVEEQRARIFVADPDGKNMRPYATGIRNPVGLAINPVTGDLWTSVNERDALGDDLVPDYITHVQDGAFYGWPWYFLGGHQDPRHAGQHPELKDKVVVPDVLLQAHSASLDMVFYDAKQFPEKYRLGAFASEHGSWNRAKRTGYKVIYVPMENGQATGEYQDFLTGFVTPESEVWGRPVGVTVARDGSLLVTDDGGNRIWRVRYKGE